MKTLTAWTVVRQSLVYFRRTHWPVLGAVAVATAVIVGALLVGDSVRGSLRYLVESRLGNVQYVLHARRFFGEDITANLERVLGQKLTSAGAQIHSVLIVDSASIERPSESGLTRAKAQVMGIAPEFWAGVSSNLHGLEASPVLGRDEVAVNAALAAELGLTVNDEVTLRFGQLTGVAGDSPLGRKEDATHSLPRQRVVAILPDDSVASIQFQLGQEIPRNVFVAATSLQEEIELENQFNALLVSSKNTLDSDLLSQLNNATTPRLEDFGLELTHQKLLWESEDASRSAEGTAGSVVYDYFQLTSRDLVLDNETSNCVVREFGSSQAVRSIIYLANAITKISPSEVDLQGASMQSFLRSVSRTEDGLLPESVRTKLKPLTTPSTEPGARPSPQIRLGFALDAEGPGQLSSEFQELSRPVPYSICVGLDRDTQLPLDEFLGIPREEMRVPYVWINSWLATEINAKPGDWISLAYYEPETVEGREIENSIHMQIVGVVPLTEPATPYVRKREAVYTQAPTIFNDPNLTPNVEGVTDQDTISDWDLPFTLARESEILDQDDEYWNNHRLTPKVFLPYRLAASTRLFGSRFGQTSSIRFEVNNNLDGEQLRQRIEKSLLQIRDLNGFVFRPIKQEQLKAASGTTPFDMLFLSLSFFVIVSALMLVSLLFKLGIVQRANQLGLMSALGYSSGRVSGLLIREFVIVAFLGSIFGIVFGLLYARLMILALETWWVGAIATPFLIFDYQWKSLVIGSLVGGVASLSTMGMSLRRLAKNDPVRLLKTHNTQLELLTGKANRAAVSIAVFAALGALGLVLVGIGQTGMAQAGCFFGSGMLSLVAILVVVRQLLEHAVIVGTTIHGGLGMLAWRALCRNPMRSSLSLGLLAIASFLIASMSVFNIAPSERGYGGFNLLGETAQPIFRNLGSQKTRVDILGEKASELRDSLIISFRARQRENASCTNLFQVTQPTILGVPSRMQELQNYGEQVGGFDWAASGSNEAPWSDLFENANGSQPSPIPVVIDQNTAQWSLKQGAAIGAITKIQIDGQDIFFRTVGLLSNSVLQGKLLISEENFERLFPEINGYRFFMIQSGKSTSEATVAATLEQGFSDEGMDVAYSQQVLTQLLAVQNTYLSAFQSLGALGLLLGTLGLVAVQLRSVMERRHELSLMRAIGFSAPRIHRILILEAVLLLAGGILIGLVSAGIALLPYIYKTGVNWSLLSPVGLIALTLAVGILAALYASMAAMKQPILEGLRSE
ncbi:MAG: ABC transporter permease [Planctomycetales bacterium]|nr:ABC transporter permease [Planctomycetales bacterium]